MKYLGFGMILLGILIVGSAEAESWFPMFSALVGLGGLTAFAGCGIVYSSAIDNCDG